MQNVTMDTTSTHEIAPALSGSVPATDAPSKSAIRVQVYSKGDTQTALTTWKDLEQKLGASPLMCSADWVSVWLEYYQDTIEPYFVVGYQGDKPCGICLLSESKQYRIAGYPLRTLHQ